ncbi:alpha/beta hydrolase [Acidothermaceae bacterium B102]|nr:alpha/beta hydrolase [Acidothermaceae bacterium B102]
MTEFLTIGEGRIAYDVSGEGPLVVLSHGMGDRRSAYRFLAPMLVDAGYRVAAADLRGSGESSVGWPSYSRTDTAGDLVALIRHLGGPAIIVGHSFAGGSATIAAADAPDLVSAVVEIGPFTRVAKPSLTGLRVARYRKGSTHLLLMALLGSTHQWSRYLDVAYPGARPADYEAHRDAQLSNLEEPGRMKALKKMGLAAPKDAAAKLALITRPALVVMGSEDPDWVDPKAEAEGIVAAMPAGLGTVAMIEGAGHYPHAQYPDAVAAVVLPFLKEHARA